MPAIELVDVHTAFDGEAVLRGVSFEVPADAITVMLGPSGVGKTTCLQHIAGLRLPDAGDVIVEGRSRLAMHKPEHLALSRRFGVLFQSRESALWGSMTVLQNMMFQLHALTDLEEDELRERSLERLHEVGLAEHADVMPGDLSAGMRTRVALARALVSDPDFALLDSVEYGVDPVRLGRVCGLIRWHRDTLGGSYLVATHDMEVARRIADHVVVLWDGQILEQGPAEDVFASHYAEIRQLLTGETDGPLALRTEGPVPRLMPAAEQGYDVAPELAAAVTIVGITVGQLVFGSDEWWIWALLGLVWIASAALIAVNIRRRLYRRGR